MNEEQFFEKFELFVDAPNAVGKMREWVLDLAVQGRLVEPRDSDGDGHSLLKALRILPPERNSKSRSPKDIPIEPETYLETPSHWALTTIENTTRDTGFFCDGDWVESKDQDPNGDVRLIQLADVGDGQYRDRSSRFMTKEAAKRLNCSYLEAGDILIARMPDPLGRCCRFPGDPKPTVTVVDVCILRSNVTYFDPDFVVIAINSPRFRQLVWNQATGTTRSRISRSNLGVLPIPLPPLAEQKRIVAKVDELMALCDQLEEQQQERERKKAALATASLARFAEAPTPANLDFIFHKSYDITPADLRKSILTLAVQGKLVPQDPNDEPADMLLQRVDAERKQLVMAKKIRRQDFLGPVVDDAIPFGIPESWQWRHLADVCFLITDGAHHTPQYQESGVPFLSVKDVSSGTIDFSNTRYISEDAHHQLCKRCQPELGDILLTKVGTTGIAVTIDESRQFSIFVSLALLKFSLSNLDRRYLKHLINSPFVKQQSADNTQGIGNKNLVLRLINRFTVPIPPLAEQRRIVTKVDQLMALVGQLEEQIAKSGERAAKLLEAVVDEMAGKKCSIPNGEGVLEHE